MDAIHAPAELSAEAALLWAWLADAIPRVGSALLVGLIGYLAARWIARALSQLIGSALGIDPTLIPAIGAFIRYGVLFFVAVSVLGQLGIQTTSVVAAVGAIGLGIGLALQGTLSNIAAGLMLLWLRPFRAGDYIETPITSGTVREVGLFATEMETFDGIFRFVPNSAIWNTPLVNYTRNGTRLFNITIGIKLEDDADKARQIVADVLSREQPDAERAPEVFIDGAADAFTYIVARTWLDTTTFWSRHHALVDKLRSALNGAGIAVQRIIHASPDVGDPRFTAAAPQPGLLQWWSPRRNQPPRPAARRAAR